MSENVQSPPFAVKAESNHRIYTVATHGLVQSTLR